MSSPSQPQQEQADNQQQQQASAPSSPNVNNTTTTIIIDDDTSPNNNNNNNNTNTSQVEQQQQQQEQEQDAIVNDNDGILPPPSHEDPELMLGGSGSIGSAPAENLTSTNTKPEQEQEKEKETIDKNNTTTNTTNVTMKKDSSDGEDEPMPEPESNQPRPSPSPPMAASAPSPSPPPTTSSQQQPQLSSSHLNTTITSATTKKVTPTTTTTGPTPQPRPPMSFGGLSTPKPGQPRRTTSPTVSSPTRTTNTRTNTTTTIGGGSTNNNNNNTLSQQQQPWSPTGPTSRKSSPAPTKPIAKKQQQQQQGTKRSSVSPIQEHQQNQSNVSPTNTTLVVTERDQQNNTDQKKQQVTTTTRNSPPSRTHSPKNNNNNNPTTAAIVVKKSQVEPAPSTAFMMSASPAITTTAKGQRPSSFSNYTIQFVKDHQVSSTGGKTTTSSTNNNKTKQQPPFFLEDVGLVSNSQINNSANSSSGRITIRALQLVDDNNTVWAAEKDGRISIFDSRTGTIKRRFERRSEYFPSCLTYVAPFMWIGFNDGSIRFFDPDTVALMKEAKEHSGPVNCFEAPVYGQRVHSEVFSGGADFMIVRWNAVTCERMAVINAHSGPIRCLSWFPQCEVLICGGDDGSIKAWTISNPTNDITSSSSGKTSSPHDQQCFQAPSTVSYQQQQQEASGLLCCSSSALSNSGNNNNNNFIAHRQGVLCVLVCQHYIWSGGSDGSVKIWELVIDENDDEELEHDEEQQKKQDNTNLVEGITPIKSSTEQHQEEEHEEKQPQEEETRNRPTTTTTRTASFKLVHEIKAPHTHAVSQLIRVGDNVWSVCLGSIFVWSGQSFEEVTRYTTEHSGYIVCGSVVREAAVARVWTAGAEGGFNIWNAESDFVPAARLSSYSFLQLSALADYSSHRFGNVKSKKSVVARRASSADNKTKSTRQHQKSTSISIGVQTVPNKIKRSTSSLSRIDENNDNRDLTRSPDPLNQQQQDENEDEFAHQYDEMGIRQQTGNARVQQHQQRRKSSSQQQQYESSSSTLMNSRRLPKQQQKTTTTSSRSQSRTGSVSQQQQQTKPRTKSETILHSRSLLQQQGIPSDETWRSLLCSTIFSTRLDAESIVKNFMTHKRDTSIASASASSSQMSSSSMIPSSSPAEVDVTSFQSIMANLNFLSEEQQQRLVEIVRKCNSTGCNVKYLRHLVFRCIEEDEDDAINDGTAKEKENENETKQEDQNNEREQQKKTTNTQFLSIPTSILPLDDWAFVNRIWLALHRRTHLATVVQNDGMTTITASSTGKCFTSSDHQQHQDDLLSTTASIPTKIAQKSEDQSQQQEEQTPPLSLMIDGINKDRKALPNDEEVFSSDQSVAQLNTWLEKQRQSILENLRVSCNLVSASSSSSSSSTSKNNTDTNNAALVEALNERDIDLLMSQEEAARQSIRCESVELFSEIVMEKARTSSSSARPVKEQQEEIMMMKSQEEDQQQQQQQENVQRNIEEQFYSSSSEQQQQQQQTDGEQQEQQQTQQESKTETTTTNVKENEQHQKQQILYVDPSKLTEDQKADIEDICVNITTSSQLLIAQQRQSQRVVIAKYSEDMDNFNAQLNYFNEKLNTQQSELSQSKKDMIQKTKEMHKLSLALGELVNDNTKLKKIVEESEDASNFQLLSEKLEESQKEIDELKEEVQRLRRFEADVNDQMFLQQQQQQDESEQQHNGGGGEHVQNNNNHNNSDLLTSPSPAAPSGGRNNTQQQEQQHYSINSNFRGSDGLPHSDRCRWLAALVHQELEKRPDKEEQHRNLLEQMEQLEVTMKEKQDSSVVRQRHAAKTLSVDLASQEVTKEVALEMVRLLRTRVEFFEERDAQWSKLSELLGDVARMHIDSFVFAEAYDELQRASRELNAVLDLRGTIGKANAEIFKLLGDVMKSMVDFRQFTENRPPTRPQMLDFVEKTETRVGVTREGVKWILSNFFSESELLHLGFSPTVFVPDDKRVKAPVPPSLMTLLYNQGNNNNNNQNGDTSTFSATRSSVGRNQQQMIPTSPIRRQVTQNTTSLIDPWMMNNNEQEDSQQQMVNNNNNGSAASVAGTTATNSHGGQIMMRERDYHQPQPAAHSYLSAPMKSKDVV